MALRRPGVRTGKGRGGVQLRYPTCLLLRKHLTHRKQWENPVKQQELSGFVKSEAYEDFLKEVGLRTRKRREGG